MHFTQQRLTVATGDDHSRTPHEAAIVNAQLVFALCILLQRDVVGILRKTVPGPDESP